VFKELQAGDPQTAGPYRLVGRLGAGGMGQVYLARSPGGRAVAVKVIRPELSQEYGFRDRFAREVAAARGVNGAFTAAVIDAAPEAAMPWMATAYVPGPSLADAVREQGPLPAESVLALGAGLAEGLQAIHAAGLVHRDLKPSNVLLAADGPRVIDFGISRAVDRSMLTTAGVVMGSPGFMSPEQALGLSSVGRPTDVFCLGAVLAFAASGDSPFGTGPVPTLMYRVVHEKPDLSQVPPTLWPLLEWCMAKDPAARPTTGELLRELSPAVDFLTPEWLPAPVAAEINRYSRTATGQADYAPPVQTAGSAAAALPAAATADQVRVQANGSGALPGTAAPTRADSYAGSRTTAAPAAGAPAPRRRRWPVAAGVGAGGAVVAVVATLILSSPGQAKPITATTSSAGPSASPSGSHTTARLTGTHPRATKRATAKSAKPATAATATPSAQAVVSDSATTGHTAAPTPTATCSYEGEPSCITPTSSPKATPACSYAGESSCITATASATPTPTPTPTCSYAGETGCNTSADTANGLARRSGPQ
jgi:eukaryotic-like serine/threonine-protein kinase